MALSQSLPFDPAAAVAIVREASRLALQLRGRVAPHIKPDNTLVTAADREIEAFLKQHLAALAPDFAFLGEETGLSGDIDAPCWVIDPIDGTTNFVRGIPLWCVSVGAVYRGEAIFGALSVPPQNEMLWAAKGAGAWFQASAIMPISELPPPLQLQLTDSDALIQEDLIAGNTTAENSVNFNGVPCRLRNLGSLAYHLSAVARGSLIACISRQHKLYDIAAGICICEEAGGVTRYLNGDVWLADVEAGKETMPLLVAPPRIMGMLLEKLQFV